MRWWPNFLVWERFSVNLVISWYSLTRIGWSVAPSAFSIVCGSRSILATIEFWFLMDHLPEWNKDIFVDMSLIKFVPFKPRASFVEILQERQADCFDCRFCRHQHRVVRHGICQLAHWIALLKAQMTMQVMGSFGPRGFALQSNQWPLYPVISFNFF